MIKILIIFAICNLFSTNTALQISSRMQLVGNTTDPYYPLKHLAANLLNVAAPSNWPTYMNSPTTDGSFGRNLVNSDTIGNYMSNWPIPNQFRGQAVNNVRLLVLAAVEGSYLAQGFVFDVASGASLTSLLVVTQKLSNPTDSNLTVEVMYAVINTRAAIKQQYSAVPYRNCRRCAKCVWFRKCCCDSGVNYVPRGNSPDELLLIKQKLTADQFAWFNQQNFATNVSRTLRKRSISYTNYNDQSAFISTLGKYLSKNTVKAEVMATYNDSVLIALQSNMTSLQLSSEDLKLGKVEKANLLMLITSLANIYGFDPKQFTSQQTISDRFSYEYLFSLPNNADENRQLGVKYIWIIGEKNDELTYTIRFLCTNITSKSLIEKLLIYGSSSNQQTTQLNIVRKSTFNNDGDFLQEQLLNNVTPWQLETANIALNILRFIGAIRFVPPKNHKMLSYFNTEIISPYTNSNVIRHPQPRVAIETILALSNAISVAAKAAQDVISVLKSSSSTTITRITRFGLNYFNQKSTVLKALGIPAARADAFIQAVILDYELPSTGTFMLGLTYSNDFTWERVQFLYSPKENGLYRSLTILKNGDSVSNTASFFIVNIDANWALAPDLLLIHKEKSILGGLWSSSKDSIQEIPHVLTLDEATKLQAFFWVVALGNMGNTLNLNTTIPAF